MFERNKKTKWSRAFISAGLLSSQIDYEERPDCHLQLILYLTRASLRINVHLTEPSLTNCKFLEIN